MKKMLLYTILGMILFWNFSFFNLLLSILILALIRNHLKSPNFINPFLMFLTTPFAFIIYNVSLSSDFFLIISDEIKIFIFLVILSFFLGLKNGYKYKKDEFQVPYNMYFVLFLSVFPHLIGFLNAGNFPLLSENPDLCNEKYQIPILNYFVSFSALSIVIAAKQTKKWNLIAVFLLLLTLAILSARRFSILFLLITFIFSIRKYSHFIKINFKSIKIRIISIVSVLTSPYTFIYFTEERSELELSEYQWFQSFEQSFDFFPIIILPYLYLTTPISNLIYNLNLNTQHTLGLFTLKPFVSLLQIDYLFEYPTKPILMPQFNTHTFIYDFYSDFNFLGTIVITFFLGVICRTLYNKSVINHDPVYDSIWISIAFAILMMFFSNHFTSVGYPIVNTLLFLIYRFISRIKTT